jgi:regulator of sigma E protease
MMENILYLLLAILGLGFLVFIHEFGHYIVARRVGMTVEAFSIGFGKPIYTWESKGVKWQICYLPFGGYVRIAGMEKKGTLEPHEIPGGFYEKKPLDRIKVALAGPVTNIIFAFLVFALIWITGGQEKPFREHTNVIGNIDTQSSLYTFGVRPGDQLTAIDGKPVQGFTDIFVEMMMNKHARHLEGKEIDYFTHKEEPFAYPFESGLHGMEAVSSLGIIPAEYLMFQAITAPGSPMEKSGIQKGDRIVWADGELIFSRNYLTQVLNEPITFLTIKRGDTTFFSRVPRLKITDLQIDNTQKAELDDWQHEAGLMSKIAQLYFIPYNLNNRCVVENPISYVDKDLETKEYKPEARKKLGLSLEPGDIIMAVDGEAVTDSFQILAKLQNRKALAIVQRSPRAPLISWKKADAFFENSFQIDKLSQIIHTIGTAQPLTHLDDLHLLSPVVLKSFSELPLTPQMKAEADARFQAQKKQIEKIDDEQVRAQQLELLAQSQKTLMLGISLEDRLVTYNPSPFTLFGDVVDQTWKTLVNLVSGSLSPKHLAGPIGIVQALQSSWTQGLKDALFWLGFVSLNLAFLNLLPLPVLDGGHILFSVIEGITKKPIKAKTMEKLIIPFIVLLIIFFVYVTYQDISRIIGRFFH